MYPKYSKKAFDNLVAVDETWVYYFEPKQKCSNRIWATKNALCPIIAKRTWTVKKVLYVIFFDNKGPVIQIPVPKGKTVTAKFYKNVVLRRLKKYYKTRHLKTGLKHLTHLHDNAQAHLVTEFFEPEKVTVLPHPPFSPKLAPATFFCFQNSNIICLARDTIWEMPLDMQFISIWRVSPLKSMKTAFKNGLTG